MTRLRAWRERVKASQGKAASLVGVSPQYWRLIEQHGVIPSGEISVRFEQLFGEPLAALIRPADIRNIPVARGFADL